MPRMLVPTVIEDQIELEAVALDPFVADLDHPSAETKARRAALLERAATAPHRRVYD